MHAVLQLEQRFGADRHANRIKHGLLVAAGDVFLDPVFDGGGRTGQVLAVELEHQPPVWTHAVDGIASRIHRSTEPGLALLNASLDFIPFAFGLRGMVLELNT